MNKPIEGLIQRLKEPDYQYYGCELSKSEADLAISALEKQIPKKAVNITKQLDIRHNANQNIGECPSCKTNIVAYAWWKTTHCWVCGQAIDWSGADE